jgi:hypothetical protein
MPCDAVGCENPIDYVCKCIVAIKEDDGTYTDVIKHINFCREHYLEQTLHEYEEKKRYA